MLVPTQNEEEVLDHFQEKPAKIVFVDTIVDALEHAVEGEWPMLLLCGSLSLAL